MNPGRPGALRNKGKKKMARRRRRRSNPRNAKGRFVKRATVKSRRRRTRRARKAAVKVTRRRSRRRARRALKANPSRRRRRRARANPLRRRRRRAHANPLRRRRRRRNPGSGIHARVSSARDRGIAEQREAARRGHAPRQRRKRRTKAQMRAFRKMQAGARRARRGGGKRKWRKISPGMKWVRSLRARARRGKKRSLKRAVNRVQYQRASVLRRLGPRRAGASAVAKAMHLRTNPGLAGVLQSAKVLVPQGAAAAAGALALGFIGSKIANALIGQAGAPAGTPTTPAAAAAASGLGSVFAPGSALAPVSAYLPAISTALVTGVALIAVDKVAPKYKGAVALGGMVAAILQGIAASPLGANPTIASAKAALGLGDYTMIGQRAYAEAGIFRNIGDYTMVGDTGLTTDAGGAYSTQRPRNSLDNRTEWAVNGYLRGADDNTEFAPGEGGLLNGGMFRGPSSR